MRCSNRFGRTVAWAAAVFAPIFLAAGCESRTAGNATGAGTIEELVEKYETAHREHSVEKLRDILWWESPQAGGRRRKYLENPMVELFDVELESVEYVEGPPPDPVTGGSVSYIRRRPGKKSQDNAVIGPVYGKLILVGSVGAGAKKRAVRVDPSYVVMQSNGRYYLDIHEFVLEDAVTSVRTGKPSRSEAHPLGADPPRLD